jgi:hypothetical protein
MNDTHTNPERTDRTTIGPFRILIPMISLVVGWWVWLTPEVLNRWPVGFDTYRDTAAVENILAGRWFNDPSIEGQPYWYAPLGPILFSGICYITGQPPLKVYSSSILWFNVLLPMGWFLMGVLCCRRVSAGIAAVLLIGVGSRWWMTHATMPLTSIQGVVISMFTLMAWQWSLTREKRWSIPVGVMLACCTWVHLVSGILAAGAIGIHALLGNRPTSDVRGGQNIAFRRRVIWVGGVSGLLVLPLAWHMVMLPRANLAPVRYFASELMNPAYALQTPTHLIWPLGVVGLVILWRRHRSTASWLIGYLLVGLLGQGIGYADFLTDANLPFVTPHEFQWHFHVAVGILGAGGATHLAFWSVKQLSERVDPGRMTQSIGLAVLGLLVAATIDGNIKGWNSRSTQYWVTATTTPCEKEIVPWIKANSSIDDVFLSPDRTDYFLIAGWTGRKIICPPEGQANISVSVAERLRDKRRIYRTQDPGEFRHLLAKYNVTYVTVTGASAQTWQKMWIAVGALRQVFRCDEDDVIIYQVDLDF